MEFKFNRGDHVSFVYGSVFSPSKMGMFEAVVNGGKIISRKGCGSSGGPEYRVDGFTGWWPEKYLVLVSRGPENLHCCEESSGATTNTQNETKCDTGDSGESENLWDVIAELSEIRAGYNLFSDKERAKYHALTVAISKLREEA